MDLLITDAQLRGRDDLVGIGIERGRIAFIGQDGKAQARRRLDATSRLTTVPFANPSMPLDKAYTLPIFGEQPLHAYQGRGLGRAMTSNDF